MPVSKKNYFFEYSQEGKCVEEISCCAVDNSQGNVDCSTYPTSGKTKVCIKNYRPNKPCKEEYYCCDVFCGNVDCTKYLVSSNANTFACRKNTDDKKSVWKEINYAIL